MFTLSHYRPQVFFKEAKILALLAMPMFLAQIAQVGTGFVDTVMAGGAGIDDLAAVALGNSLFVTIYVTLIGVMTALNPILSHKFGQKATLEIGEIGRQGIWLGLFLGLFGMVLMMGAVGVFRQQFDLNANTTAIMSQYIYFVALGMPAAMIHRALHAYAISLDKPAIITYISWICFFANIPLNYLFVYGVFGLPKLGGAGCGLATALVFWLNTLLLGAYLAKNRYFKPFGLTDKFSPPNLAMIKQFLGLGVPIGLSFFIEVSLFTCIMFLVAKLGGNTENYVAAQQVVINLTSLLYMIPKSIGVAATTRVGFSLGKRQFAKARYISGVSLSLALMMAMMTACILLVAEVPLARLYTDNVAVIGIATSLMVFAATFQLVDAAQCVASYALRGYKITRLPMVIHTLAFWGCGLLPGYYLAFYQGMGIYGFWWALVVSLSVAAVLLVWYLEYHSKMIVNQHKS